MISAGVGRQLRTPSAQHLGDGLLDAFAGPIPQQDVDRTVPHVIELPQRAFADVVDELPLTRILADELGNQRHDLREGYFRPTPLRDIFAATAIRRADHERKFGNLKLAARPVHEIETAGIGSEVGRLVGELVDLDAIDSAHV